MATPFLGQIKLFAGNFAPQGYAFCDGRLLSIAENDALFALIGTSYGGDGQSTFGLPDLRGRVPIHQGAGFVMGQAAGTESETLTLAQLPAHNHAAQGTSAGGNQQAPTGHVWAASSLNSYSTGAPNATLNAGSIGAAGGNQPHENRMPFLAISFIIALQGIFPSRN